ncbi:MAG: flagellar protein FliT [Deltaproteobacteria bacterium]|nr:flagellar protein FliT [Deltaproteobacteria bacterium]
MSSPGELVRRLERLWVEPTGADLGKLTGMLEERQKILDQLQKADTRALSPESQAALRVRVDEVRRRDAKLLAALMEQREEAEKQLQGLLRGRSAARGYASAMEPTPAVFNREG